MCALALQTASNGDPFWCNVFDWRPNFRRSIFKNKERENVWNVAENEGKKRTPVVSLIRNGIRKFAFVTIAINKMYLPGSLIPSISTFHKSLTKKKNNDRRDVAIRIPGWHFSMIKPPSPYYYDKIHPTTKCIMDKWKGRRAHTLSLLLPRPHRDIYECASISVLHRAIRVCAVHVLLDCGRLTRHRLSRPFTEEMDKWIRCHHYTEYVRCGMGQESQLAAPHSHNMQQLFA